MWECHGWVWVCLKHVNYKGMVSEEGQEVEEGQEGCEAVHIIVHICQCLVNLFFECSTHLSPGPPNLEQLLLLVAMIWIYHILG